MSLLWEHAERHITHVANLAKEIFRQARQEELLASVIASRAQGESEDGLPRGMVDASGPSNQGKTPITLTHAR